MIGAKAVDTDGKEIGRNKLISAKGKLSLQILPEKTEVKEGEIVYVDVNIAGENGCVESNADEEVTVKVEGGTLLGSEVQTRGQRSGLTQENTIHTGDTLRLS